jgi:CRP-like cAMP-binding protein
MRLDALRLPTLLGELSDNTRQALFRRTTIREFDRGAALFRTGDEPDGIYSILSGKVKLTRRPHAICQTSCQENLLLILGEDQCFGELSVLDPGPRNSTAIALTPVRVRFVAKEDAETLIALFPDFARCLLHQVSRRLRLAQNATSAMVLHDVPGRVARAILLLATRFGEVQRDGSIHVRHDITQSEIASMVGASREAVNKAMTDFANRQWVILRTRSLVVLDRERLRARAGGWAWDNNPLTQQRVGVMVAELSPVAA